MPVAFVCRWSGHSVRTRTKMLTCIYNEYVKVQIFVITLEYTGGVDV